jgi:hypothetical protein
MINFRFHIVSLTAVLLALGIGLVLGTTFLDDATISGLERQLSGLENDLDSARERNDEQGERLSALEDESDQLSEQMGERLYEGALEDVPVLVVTTQGVDDDEVDAVTTTLLQADARVVGVWWLTDRLDLGDEGEVSDLSEALELSTDDRSRVARSLASQLADVLYGATEPAPDTAPDDVGGDGDVERGSPAEPALLTRLRDAGFVVYQVPEGVDDDVVRLPGSDLRVVVVDDAGAVLPAESVVMPVLRELTADGPMPVVVTQPAPEPGDDDEDALRLVDAVRDDDSLRDLVSSVDNLHQVSGRLATLLATVDATPGQPTIGRYGTGDGADRLLPPSAGEE